MKTFDSKYKRFKHTLLSIHMLTNPDTHMQNTMKYRRSNFVGEELKMRMSQVRRGLEAGRDELVKITKRYLLKVPIVLLVLCQRQRGTAFLRAVLSVLHENSGKVPEGFVLFYDKVNGAGGESSAWGRYIYINPDHRPDDEKVWYDLLTQFQ